MKPLLLIGLMTFSGLSFGKSCHISLYEGRHPWLNFYSNFDSASCTNAASRCYQTIQANRLDPRVYKCYTIRIEEDPRPNPQPMPRVTPKPPQRLPYEPLPVDDVVTGGRPQQPQPTTQPQPTPEPRVVTPTVTPTPTPTVQPQPAAISDSRRNIDMGETVVFQSRLWVVTDLAGPGFYNLKPVGGRDRDIVADVARQYVSVTRGCHLEICTKHSVIDMRLRKYVAVEGIDYNGKFITKDIEEDELIFDVDVSLLAKTVNACLTTESFGVCTGNTVVTPNNRYYKLVGIQPNGKVVLEKEDDRNLVFDVDPATLTITQ